MELFIKVVHASHTKTLQQEHKQHTRVFFPGGSPRWQNFCPSPNRPPSPLFLLPELVPQISKILPHFSLKFDYFWAQNCIRKLYFMLKTSKFALIVLWGGGGIFGFGKQFFQVPSHLTPSPMRVPPSDLSLTGTENHPWKQVPPTKNFVKKTHTLKVKHALQTNLCIFWPSRESNPRPLSCLANALTSKLLGSLDIT